MVSCQSKDELGMPKNNSNNDADWELSYEPNGVEYVNTGDQSVEIDFTPDETIEEAIFYRNPYYMDNGRISEGDLFYTFSTFDKLAEYYDRCQLGYQPSYSSLSEPYGGETVFPPIEYALAQECFRDDCPAETRKAILRMALDKHERKISDPYLASSSSRRTGMFLMAVILVKEKDAAFLTAVSENPDIQNALRLNLDTESQLSMLDIDGENDLIICQLAENFLLEDN